MPLKAVLGSDAASILVGDDERVIHYVTDDSRDVVPGSLFLARHPRYVAAALDAGAVAVVLGADELEAPGGPGLQQEIHRRGLALIRAECVDQAFAGRLAATFYRRPAEQLSLIGITGTNGKTTTALMTRYLLDRAGCAAGLIGTIGIDTGGPRGARPATLTTPGALEVQRLWAEMVTNQQRACVMEVSSHGLEQGRVRSQDFRVGVFTNLTQDHLDYHGTMEAYAQAKARLFKDLPTEGVAIVNADDPAHRIMLKECQANTIACHFGTFDTTGQHVPPKPPGDSKSNAWLESVALDADHSRADFVGPWGRAAIRLPMVGGFNLANALQAACAAWALKPFESDPLAAWLADVPAVPGRLEPIPNSAFALGDVDGDDTGLPTVLVDYAHTPDAVARALDAVRPVTRGRLIALMGCGGDRDARKRPQMAQAARERADHLVITSDNPRTEDPAAIVNDMLSAWTEHPVEPEDDPCLTIELDRARAIQIAVAMAEPDDTVMLCGKGHEDYQIIGTEHQPFDDRRHALDALRRRVSRPDAASC